MRRDPNGKTATSDAIGATARRTNVVETVSRIDGTVDSLEKLTTFKTNAAGTGAPNPAPQGDLDVAASLGVALHVPKPLAEVAKPMVRDVYTGHRE